MYVNLVDVSIENYKKLVQYAIDNDMRNLDVIWLEDKDGKRYITLSQIELLEEDGMLSDSVFRIINVESIDECIKKIQNVNVECNGYQDF